MENLDFRCLFEAVPGLFLVLQPDAEFTILGASDMYLAATHTQREQIVGRGLFEIFPDNPDDPAATGTSNLRASLLRVLQNKIVDTMAVQKYDVRRGDGSFEERHWSPLNLPVFGAAGELRYILHRVEDITDFVRLSREGEQERSRSVSMEREIVSRSLELDAANKKLRDANTRLSELDHAKTAFFNNISHEFRTPLTLMLGPIEEGLRDQTEPLLPRQRKRLELAHANSLRLFKLVNSLLDFARLEASRMRANFAPTDLARLTRETAHAFESAMEGAGLDFRVECAALSEPAYVDREMWEKIVLNLVSNALKFTFDGLIEVALREEAERFVLHVRDTGTGIPESELARLFERFHRVEGARSRSHEGTGIGLSLVQELVRLHQGEVSVRSEAGKGSTFSVTIPKGKAHLPAEQIDNGNPDYAPTARADAFVAEARRWAASKHASDAAAEPQTADDAKPRILIVEDNADLRGYVKSLLQSRYRVLTAADGAAGLETALLQSPDLILSDVMMPRMNGLELLRELRRDERMCAVPFIFMSARAGEEAAIDGLDAGADDYVAKPFSAQELVARVDTHLRLERLRRTWAEKLAQSNQELEAFSYSIAHDLRAPLRAVLGYSDILRDDCGEQLDEEGVRRIAQIQEAARRMAALIDDLLNLSRIGRSALDKRTVSITALAGEIVGALRQREPQRNVEVTIAEQMTACADARLLKIVLENLIGNAWKFSAKRAGACISIGGEIRDGETSYYVRDNGAGFDMRYAEKLFAPFQRLHADSDFEGTGIGLAIVQRIVAKHGGRIGAEGKVGDGAIFRFTLPD